MISFRINTATVLCLVFVICLKLLVSSASAGLAAPIEDDETVQQLIREWDAGNFGRIQKASKALAALGEKAVPALTKLINENHRHAGYAFQTLARMGPEAKAALPAILKLARNKEAKDPEGWTWNMSVREILLSNMRKMSWGAKEFAPMLEAIGSDEQETEQIRSMAVSALQGMGPEALPALRKFIKSDVVKLRASAARSIVQIQTKAGAKKTDVYQEIIDSNPFDSNVPDYLASMKGIYNQGRPHAATQRVKELCREALAKKADPQIAWQLATIIQHGLSGTSLMWRSPSNSYSRRSQREDPGESYKTLSEALDIVLASSEPGSELWKKAGYSLARLRLLQGDWDGMNVQLQKIGQQPVSAELRGTLPAAPSDWKNLKEDWQPADESMRSGNCGIEFRFVRRGQRLRGIKGVHVLVKLRPEPAVNAVFNTGINVDTLLLATQPLTTSSPFGAFGYRGADRTRTRYAISNDKGVVRIENLPNKPMLVEVLVPTANFAKRGHKWDLLMATPDGAKSATRGEPGAVDPNKPPALVELTEGETVRYPMMFVRSQLFSSVHDWDSVDKNTSVVTWSDAKDLGVEHYNVNLSLTAPSQLQDAPARSPRIAKASVTTKETTWSLGEQGVGDMRLVPGNMYVLQIDAIRGGTVVGSTPPQRIWVPWEHRTSDPPKTGLGHMAAFYNDIWLRTSANGKSLEERLPVLIKDSADMFETEYHRLGMAWLDLHKNKAGAMDKLRNLTRELPEGNIVRTTAQSLIDGHKDGLPIPKRFKFVGP